ncbi:cysteine--tRNA ligase [Candidatus Peregrinibacteria bacterium CG08_land_8_20_14_0_20_41_10]|nr:MAG: cysteine--tRNA ligase [Candidatus Peregrinibacteria bacterium CG08_land_8_20_14_0_20_41_10]
MPLFLYNSLTRQKELFKPIRDPEVKMYTCGPTVYDYAHIGNMSAYLMADTLRRVLEYLGYRVTLIQNITDVGHLVSDADTGEDKMEKAATREKKDPLEIARFYEKAFLEDTARLNVLPATKYVRATEHITEMIELIKTLEQKGYTYQSDEAVYFDTAKFSTYGQHLNRQSPDEMLAGASVEVDPHKKQPFDFVLWFKRVGKHAQHIMHWPSPWGEGFPGWHIECSAMSMQYLGPRLDIHTGGEDHLLPHHECEIAQSEAATGKKFVNFWVHKKHIFMEGEKMSKSKGNTLTLQNLIDKGYSPREVRYLLISAHYRQQANFTFKGLDQARETLKSLDRFIQTLTELNPTSNTISPEFNNRLQQLNNAFIEAISDDLNLSEALGKIFEFIKENNSRTTDKTLSPAEAHHILELFKNFNQVLGVLEFSFNQTLPADIQTLITARDHARAEKNWAESDHLREELIQHGYEVSDTPTGTKVRK